jgi:hypothetical protein
MVQLSATRCSCIAILWFSLVNFAVVTLCVASQQVFIVVTVYFVIDSVRKFWIHPRITYLYKAGFLFLFYKDWTLWSPSNTHKLNWSSTSGVLSIHFSNGSMRTRAFCFRSCLPLHSISMSQPIKWSFLCQRCLEFEVFCLFLHYLIFLLSYSAWRCKKSNVQGFYSFVILWHKPRFTSKA